MIRALLLSALMPFAAHAESLAMDPIIQGEVLSGWQVAPDRQIAAVHLQLAPEWKTYWRAPGDAGIPPAFDWGASENLRSVHFHWPAPEAIVSNGLMTVGYHDALTLPIEVVAIDPSKPVILRASLSLGVCKDVCLPADLAISAQLVPSDQHDSRIKAALDAGPMTAREGGVTAIHCDVAPIKDGLRVTARTTLPALGSPEAVVIESGLPDVWVSSAETARDGGTLTATVDMVPPERAPFSLSRDGVVVTVIGQGGHAVEIRGCPAP